MSEIEKMYKLANVKAINIAEYGSTYIPKKIEIDGKPYPSFTAERQIELIKWFVTNNAELETLEITYYLNDCFQISSCTKSSHFEADFENAIAGLINNLWEDLTEEEKQQIKEILNEKL